MLSASPALLLALALTAPAEAAPPTLALQAWHKGQAALDADRVDPFLVEELVGRLEEARMRARRGSRCHGLDLTEWSVYYKSC